ncbi:MAG: HAD family phosphatase [Candidatus Levybacteria bacterium]|nr:HAD family phosphatase [Candidatus Levybacteria bacterium]
MIKAVIFDMDGVIIDSEPINSKSWEKLLSERDITPILSSSGLIHEVGPVGNETYKEIMKRHNIKDNVKTIRKRRRELFEELLKEKLTPNSGFLKLIKLLKKEKIKTAVASNRLIKHVHLILENLGVKNFFKVIVGPNPTLKYKPAPDIFLQTAKELDVKPWQCVVIEDSETGILSAKAAGMKVIAVPNKYTKHHNFSKSDKIVNSLSDITVSMLNNL